MLCRMVARGEECKYGDRCHQDHDVAKYLAMKEADAGGDLSII
tara:strand:- start:358 stop:486 length:129 start_codon:yes stop_codon:yes gene_type:complete